jgi:hypothetical protein
MDGGPGTVVYTSDLLNFNNTLLSPTKLEVLLTSPLQVNFIRVCRLSSNFPRAPSTALIDEANILSLGEVEVFGLTKEAEFCGNPFDNCALYCVGVGERSGCSGCAATNGTCTWCADPNNQALGACVILERGATCGTDVLKTRISTWEPSNHLCPKDFIQERRQKGKNIHHSHREWSFSEAHVSNFCQFPQSPYVVDRWAGARGLSASTLRTQTTCAAVNSHFGLLPGAMNKTHFLKLVGDNCRSSENPLLTGIGRECMRLMQTAYCSSFCPQYGSPRGRPCFDWDTMFRACGKWATPTSRIDFDTAPLENGCPLDPNNIPKASVIEKKCDPFTPIVYSGLWEETFGLYTPIPKQLPS